MCDILEESRDSAVYSAWSQRDLKCGSCGGVLRPLDADVTVKITKKAHIVTWKSLLVCCEDCVLC